MLAQLVEGQCYQDIKVNRIALIRFMTTETDGCKKEVPETQSIFPCSQNVINSIPCKDLLQNEGAPWSITVVERTKNSGVGGNKKWVIWRSRNVQ